MYRIEKGDRALLRPTKRFLIDLWGLLVFLVIMGVVRPWVGDPMLFSARPATPVTIFIFYAIGLVVTALAARDMFIAVRTGGAFVRGPRQKASVVLDVGRWTWVGRLSVGANEGLWFTGKCLDSTSELVTFTLGLAKPGMAGQTPEFTGNTYSREIAWEAEDFPDETLIPSRPGTYMLGIRASCASPGTVQVKLVWGATPIRK